MTKLVVVVVVSMMMAMTLSSANALLNNYVVGYASLSTLRNIVQQQRHQLFVGSSSMCRAATTTETIVVEANDTAKKTSMTKQKASTEFLEVDALFDSIDTNNDNGISNEELKAHLESIGYATESIRLLFTVIDKNADGMISKAEMRYAWDHYDTDNLYKAFGLSISTDASSSSLKSVATKKHYDQIVDSIRSDANKNDTTDNNEITEAVSTSPELLTKLADIIFDLIDTDQNNEIDVEELRLHFRVNGSSNGEDGTTTIIREIGHASLVSSESILTALDLNHDGVISRQEMRDGFNQYNPRTLSRALGLQVS